MILLAVAASKCEWRGKSVSGRILRADGDFDNDFGWELLSLQGDEGPGAFQFAMGSEAFLILHCLSGLFDWEHRRASRNSLRAIFTSALAWLFLSGLAIGQAYSPSSITVNRPVPPGRTPESNLVYEGMVSYGNYRIFAGGSNAHLYTSGVEYDRNSWGYFLKARMDYAAEFLPMVILNEPAKLDIWGDTIGPGRNILYGIGISPIGLRMVWRNDRGLQPYFEAKGGVLVFDQKALSPAASYEEFTLQQNMGMLVRISPRYDLRLGLFGDFHFSNGFMVPVNPGLDVMNASFGLSYHLGRPRGPG